MRLLERIRKWFGGEDPFSDEEEETGYESDGRIRFFDEQGNWHSGERWGGVVRGDNGRMYVKGPGGVYTKL